MAPRLPRLNPGALPAAHECRRKFAHTLTGTHRVRGDHRNTDRRFRLQNAVVSAVRRAHAEAAASGTPPSDALVAETPPRDLEPEERTAFTEALEHYGHIADARGGDVPRHPPPQFARMESRTGRYELSITVDVALAIGDALEVRRLAFAPPRVADLADLADDPRARLTALVLGANPGLRYAHLDLAAGAVHEIEIDEPMRRAWGAELQTTVLAALDDPDPPATPGLWCSSCEVVAGCPEVPSGELAGLAAPPGGEPG